MSQIITDASESKVLDFGPPFNDEDADLILRSSDNKNFRVYRAIVCKASTILKERVSNLSSNDADDSGKAPSCGKSLPVLTIPADSDTLHSLLSTILPVQLYLSENFEKSAPVLSLAEKYQMKTSVGLIQKIVLASSPGVVQTMDPYEAYFLACRYGLSKVATLVASRTVSEPMTMEKCMVDSLRFVSASALNALWKYRSRSGMWGFQNTTHEIEHCFKEPYKPFHIQRAYGPPFDRSDADIVLRSSDMADFSVYKAVLSMASPVFDAMFTLPRPAGRNSVPIVDVTESSQTLSILLSTILPVPAISKLNIEEMFPVLAAAQKYEMTCASSWIRVLLRQDGNPITLINAFRVYGLASEWRLQDEGKTAASLTLRLPMTFEAIATSLPKISGAALYALWKYRKAYFQSAQSCFQDACKPSTSLSLSLCKLDACRNLNPKTKMPIWWTQFCEDYAGRFSDLTQPLPQWKELEAAFRGAMNASGHNNQYQCSACSRIDGRMITSVCSILTKELELAVKNVSIDFDAW
ncbi:hypothetical protein OF83DRAFT_1287696 [Amylostereum chailletii]|nr:hypothetical protein OF83DRAFT_1287696 [Amylostereum chailletii]